MTSIQKRFWSRGRGTLALATSGMMIVATSAMTLTLIGGAGACSESPAAPVDRRSMLQEVATNVIVPTYTDVDTQAAALATTTQALQTSPTDATLTAAQNAWRQTRAAWNQSDAFAFGPAETLDTASAVNGWPAKGELIDAQLTATAPITQDAIEALGANAKGFFALEYLLFDADKGSGAVLAALTDPKQGPRRRAYVAALATNLKSKTAALLTAWRPDGGNFVSELAEAGNGSKTYPSQRNALDTVINRLAVVSQDVYENQLGLPFGRRTGGQAQPEQERARRSDNSVADARNSLQGVQNIYMGAYGSRRGLGVSDAVKAKNEAVDERLQGMLTTSQGAIAAIPSPFHTSITAHRSEVQQAIDATVKVRKAIASEVASLLGATLQFSDNDGD